MSDSGAGRGSQTAAQRVNAWQRLWAGTGSAFAQAGGAIAAAFLLLSTLCYRTLAEPTVARDAPLAHALVVLSYLAGGPAITVPLVPMVGVVAAAALRERVLARWTGWLGVLAAVCGAACASTFLGLTNNHSATYGILLLGAVLMFAWLVVTSIALIARTRGAVVRRGLS
jgi:hypothetical protein